MVDPTESVKKDNQNVQQIFTNLVSAAVSDETKKKFQDALDLGEGEQSFSKLATKRVLLLAQIWHLKFLNI